MIITYIAHTESIIKELGLQNVKDMLSFKILGNNKLIMQKIIERSHSLSGFSKYTTIEKYEYECTKNVLYELKIYP